MARAGREKSESGVYHVLLRGAGGLFKEKSDYIEFRSKLSEYFGKNVRLLAFLLLSNRVHLIIDEGDGELSKALKPLCTSYARYFNRTYGASGKLFYDRYKSVPLDKKEDIADSVAFLNALSRRFAGKETSSLAEYLGTPAICDTKHLRFLIGERAESMKPRALHLDDYTQLSKEDFEEILKIVADCTLEELSRLNRNDERFKRIFSQSVTARAVLPLFGVHIKSPRAKKPEKPDEKEDTPRKNLSVWLL